MKEIKIMGRADFAGDVALWIFTIYIYIYFCVYIYIFIIIIIIIPGPLSTILVAFPRVGYGRALNCLRVVRDASGLSSPDPPVVKRA